MKIDKRIESDVAILTPTGRIDPSTMGNFSESLITTIDEGYKKVLVDFSKTEYMSSAGIRAIVEGMKKLEGLGGTLAFCTPSENLQELFSVVQLDKVIKIYKSEFEALDALM